MLSNIAYFMIFGRPLVLWLGLISLILIILAALIATLNMKFKIRVIPFKWHSRVAGIAVVFSLIHGILALWINFFN